eukprot:m.47317 g.47317  ORF g.47317 m.47317 type:complete len:203 (+) comp10480_c0_seq1:178-786(+)
MAAQMEKHLFNLKLAAKQLERMSKKCEKNEKSEKNKIKTDIAKGRVENARVHAENAIREKNQALNFLRLSARVDSVAQRVQTAVQMRKVTSSMSGVVKGMDRAMASMNLVQMTQLMDKFESQFEDLDVQIDVMDQAMGSTSAMATPEGEVRGLMEEVADAHNLELGDQMSSVASGPLQSASVANEEQNDLSDRLARLRDASR